MGDDVGEAMPRATPLCLVVNCRSGVWAWLGAYELGNGFFGVPGSSLVSLFGLFLDEPQFYRLCRGMEHWSRTTQYGGYDHRRSSSLIV